jgi:hypothetical protein
VNKTKEEEAVQLIREFVTRMTELDLDFYDLVTIRDKYFPCINTGRIVDPVGVAQTITFMEEHCMKLKKLMHDLFGIQFKEQLRGPSAIVTPDNLDSVLPKAQKETKVEQPEEPEVLPPPAAAFAKLTKQVETIVDGLSNQELGGRSKGVVRRSMEALAEGKALTKKDIRYLESIVPKIGKPLSDLLELMKEN